MSSAALRRAAHGVALLVVASGVAGWRGAYAQDIARIAGTDSAHARGAPAGDLLSRSVTLELDDVPLERALYELARKCELRFSYSSDIVPVDRRVSISREDTPVGAVLRELLQGTDIDPVVTPSGYVVLVRHPGGHKVEYTTFNIGLGGTLSSTTLAKPDTPRPQLMDRVLIMGTPATGAPERELATAVTVLTAGQIAARGASTMEELLRGEIPGVVAWDLGITGPFAQIGSVRGSSSFTANYLKTYVDGVELASPYMLFAIDPFSIERIEIIRGPQGSALYGSDAISGVVQVVTRRGSTAAQWHPRFDALVSGGMQESKYIDGASGTQRHSVMFSTGGGLTSLGLGGTYAASGAVAPGGNAGTRGTFGGFRHIAGPLRVEGTLRYADVRFTAPENPLFRGQDLPPSVRPPIRDQRIENETYGLTLDLQPVPSWRQTLVVGLDRNAGAIPQQREPATVADALLGATRERVSKSSVRYSTAWQLLQRHDSNGAATSTGLVTLGVEHWHLARERLGLQSDLSGAGDGVAALYHDDIANTGVFGQFKLDLSRALFITAGLRGEHNSTFGEHFGTAWSPMLGTAYTRDLGHVTAKLRLAYGKGIRPPAPSARRAFSTVNYRQVANPLLRPESQSGVEGGLELYSSDRASVSITGYSQQASGLIQEVIFNRDSVRAFQYQNVGRIANRGLEFEGSARGGPVRARASFALTRSHVRALSATYSGDLAVGDRVPEVPGASGLVSLSYDAGRTRFTLGSTIVGSWMGYDWVRFIEDELATTTPEPSLRDYLYRYPGVVKPFVSVSALTGHGLEWFARVDNLGNVQRNERDNLQITPGRTFTLGIRIGR